MPDDVDILEDDAVVQRLDEVEEIVCDDEL